MHHSRWDDGRVVDVAVGAVVDSLVVAQPCLHRRQLVEGSVTLVAPKQLRGQPRLRTHLQELVYGHVSD